jgi:penicillin-binding protein 1A
MDTKAEQYYPTYKFNENSRDVVLIEFEEAQKLANSQTKVYTQVASVLVAVVAIVIPLFFNQDKTNTYDNVTILKENSILFALITTISGGFLLRYFVELQRQITFNARKVVTLRLMLGLDYGSIHLTIPNFRVEGATNPFVIKFFNGWFWFQSVPFWILTIVANLSWFIAIQNSGLVAIIFGNSIMWTSINFAIFTWYFYIYRCQLFELHEDFTLLITKVISQYIFRLKLLENFEYIIYRAKLAYIELDRLSVDYDHLKKIIIKIEDKSFNSNKGISLKSLARALMSQFSYLRKKRNLLNSGGSTITMQLARSMFIPSNQNKYLRKVTEILMSRWLNSNFSKDELIKFYICSVRYERGVIGLSKAIKYFFNDEVERKKLTAEESFLLVERLSNISSKADFDRVKFLVEKTELNLDLGKIIILYRNLERDKNKIQLINFP